jgi:hypothetical protein
MARTKKVEVEEVDVNGNPDEAVTLAQRKEEQV